MLKFSGSFSCISATYSKLICNFNLQLTYKDIRIGGYSIPLGMAMGGEL